MLMAGGEQQARGLLHAEHQLRAIGRGERVAICGTGELAELVYLALREMNIDCVGFVDGNTRDTFLSYPVASPERVASWQLDRVLIADLEQAAAYEEQLVQSGIPREKLLRLGFRQ